MKLLFKINFLENDISNQEFDNFFQKCLVEKKQKQLASQSQEESDFGEEYEEYYEELTDMEIDRALEEAERWCDF